MTLTNTNHNINDLKSAIEGIKAVIKDKNYEDHYQSVLKCSKSKLSPHFYENKYGKDLNALV